MKHILIIITFLLSFSFVNAQSMSSTNELENSSLYPNPATSQVNIKFSHPNKASYVAIYSIIGNEVLNKKVDQSTNFKLNINNLKRGKYIVRVFNVDGTTESLALIKN